MIIEIYHHVNEPYLQVGYKELITDKDAEQLKLEIQQDHKLRELLDKRIELLLILIEKKKEQNEPFKWVTDMIEILKNLQRDSEKKNQFSR